MGTLEEALNKPYCGTLNATQETTFYGKWRASDRQHHLCTSSIALLTCIPCALLYSLLLVHLQSRLGVADAERSDSCCRHSDSAGHYWWEPQNCRLRRLTSSEARQCLNNRHIFFGGDSLTRSTIFLSFCTLFGAQQEACLSICTHDSLARKRALRKASLQDIYMALVRDATCQSCHSA